MHGVRAERTGIKALLGITPLDVSRLFLKRVLKQNKSNWDYLFPIWCENGTPRQDDYQILSINTHNASHQSSQCDYFDLFKLSVYPEYTNT